MVNNCGSLIYLISGAEPPARAVKATRATLIARARQAHLRKRKSFLIKGIRLSWIVETMKSYIVLTDPKPKNLEDDINAQVEIGWQLEHFGYAEGTGYYYAVMEKERETV